MLADGRLIYLAYGSNLHPRRLAARIGDARLLGVVRLPGWRLTFDKRGADGSAKANLRPAPGSAHVAWSAAYEIHSSQLPLLDHFEGCGRGYETILMDVMLGGRVLAAHAYLTPSHWTTQGMRPFDWYLELVLAGARWHGLPESYIDEIECRDVMVDTDMQRSRLNLDSIQGI